MLDINAVAYMRLSADEKHTGSMSFMVQADHISKLSTIINANIVESVQDNAISGAVPFNKRPGGKRVTNLIVNGQINAILALRQERIFRDTKEALLFVDMWLKQGVTVYFAEDNGSPLDVSSPAGRMMFTMKAAVASYEREQTAVRVKENKNARKMQGKTYSAPRYGYNHVDGYEVPNPVELEVIQRIKDMRKRGFSLRGIGGVLDSEGHKTKQGKSKWSAQIVKDILDRPPED
jgi:DNA invertase Pin-like site-specific DNA recombinase